MQLRSRRATVMGLGRHGGGVAAARFLATQGARVTVTDLAPAESLAESVAALADSPIERFRLGYHEQADFREAELLVVNPAVKPDSRWVAIAAVAGAKITSEIELFLERCPAQVIGVTGTSGKSTTSAMIAAIVEAAGRRAWLGGNIGRSLLADLPRIDAGDVVVLELSSFQLFWLGGEIRRLSENGLGERDSPILLTGHRKIGTVPDRSRIASKWPTIAVVTNFAPNHLDWHGDVEHYRRAKQRLIHEQRGEDVAIMDVSDKENGLADWLGEVRGRLVSPPPLKTLPPLQLIGDHNRRCAALAAAASKIVGADQTAVDKALAAFRPLAHRLNFVGEVEGRRFYNDSKATTPEAAIAGLKAMAGRTWILLGGSDKGADFDELATAAGRHACGAALFGAVALKIAESLAQRAAGLPIYQCETLAEALQWCWRKSRLGDAILLSPGCASLDQFRDFAARGAAFVELVTQGLTGRHEEHEGHEEGGADG